MQSYVLTGQLPSEREKRSVTQDATSRRYRVLFDVWEVDYVMSCRASTTTVLTKLAGQSQAAEDRKHVRVQRIILIVLGIPPECRM